VVAAVGPMEPYGERDDSVADELPYKTIADFSGGLLTYPPPYKLGENAMRELNSLLVSPHASLELVEGQTNFFTSISGVPIRAMTRATLSGGMERFVYGVDQSLATSGIFSYNENTLATTQVSTFNMLSGSRFVLFDNKVIWIGSDSIFGRVKPYVWDGNSVSDLGVSAPSSALTATIASPSDPSDALVAIASDPLYYWVTYFNPATGVESNPTTIDGIFTPSNGLSQGSLTDPFQADLTSIPSNGVSWRRIYRQGGGLPSPRRVAQLSDTGTTTYTDNLPNLQAIDREAMSFSHDAPPTFLDIGPSYIMSHKRRLLIFNDTTVYISSLGEPYYFPQIVTFPQTDGDILPIDGDLTNPIVSACPIGGAVFIGRRKDCWMLSGEDTDTFVLGGVCTVGCIAPLSLVSCGDIPVWLAPDRQVWAMTGTGPVKLSEGIQDTLKAISLEDAYFACACYHRNNYLLSFPDRGDGTGLLLIYDFDTKVWYEHSRSYTIARYLYGDTGASDGDEVLIATTEDFTNIGGGAYVGVVRLFTDAVSNLDLFLKSGDLLFDRPHDDKKIANIRILGTLDTPPGETVTLTITAIKERKDGTSTTNSATFPLLENAEGVLLDTDVPAGIVGQRIWYSIGGVANTFKLDVIELGYSLVGDRRA
jgi:hypothetical protein